MDNNSFLCGMANTNFTFEDFDGALILISYDTVSTEEEGETWSNCLPYTFENGNLIRYELDGDDDIDQYIDLDSYGVAQMISFDVGKFATANDLLIKILLTEGREIIREAPFNEEEVVDNRITLKLYDASRNEILSRSRKIGRKTPKQPSVSLTERVYTPEELESIGVSFLKAQRALCISGWRELGFHLLLLVAAGALSMWVFRGYQLSTGMDWVFSAFFGLYFTQIWWCNKRTCPIFVAWPLTKRAEGRPWINGGMLIGLGLGILLICIPEVSLADAFLVGSLIAYCVTIIWGVFSWLNSLLDGPENILVPALKNMERSNRRAARRSFFDNMFGF